MKIRMWFFVAIIAAFSLSIFALTCLGADKKEQTAEQPAAAKPAKKELTKSEILDNIKVKLGRHKEVFDMIPDLKAEKDDAGNVLYLFKGVKLDDMLKDDLSKLLISTNRIITKVQTERIQKQLETIARAQNMQKIVVPPQPPAQPPPQPAPPKVYSPPPQPPSSRR